MSLAQILNITGFRKALKKFEKVTKVHPSELVPPFFMHSYHLVWMHLPLDYCHGRIHERKGACDCLRLTQSAHKLDIKIEPSAFTSGKTVSKMTKEMEDLFAARFGTHP